MKKFEVMKSAIGRSCWFEIVLSRNLINAYPPAKFVAEAWPLWGDVDIAWVDHGDCACADQVVQSGVDSVDGE